MYNNTYLNIIILKFVQMLQRKQDNNRYSNMNIDIFILILG